MWRSARANCMGLVAQTRRSGFPQGFVTLLLGKHIIEKYRTCSFYNAVSPGSNTVGRVPWEKQLSYGEVQRFVDIRFIDDGWLSNQP